MARSTFGGTANDILLGEAPDGTLRYVTGVLTFWSVETGGSQYVDLVLGLVGVASIPVGANGRVPEFQGPDGITEMWADAGGDAGRVLLLEQVPSGGGGGGGGGATTLDGLTDVAITGHTAGDMLVDDGTNYVDTPTTTYGRALLAVVNQAALLGLFPSTSETVPSLSEVATQAETTTGTDDVRHITPLKLAQRLASLLDSTTTLGVSNTVVPTQGAVKAYADGLLDANNAYQYKGAIDCSANPSYPAASAGHTYKVSVAGKIGGASGPNVEVGDTLTCLVDSTSAGTQAAVGANWIIIQTNIDGAVVGPASSTASDFATFSGTTGKIVQDSGVSLDTDGTLAANADTKIPSQKAVKTYAQQKATDLTTIAGLSPSNDDVLQRKAGAWVNRTLAQLRTDLAAATAQANMSPTTTGNSATPTPAMVAERTYMELNALTGAAAFANPTGSPQAGWALTVRIKSAAAQALSFPGTQYRDGGPGFPSTTVAGKWLTLGFLWNATDTKLDLVSKVQQP